MNRRRIHRVSNRHQEDEESGYTEVWAHITQSLLEKETARSTVPGPRASDTWESRYLKPQIFFPWLSWGVVSVSYRYNREPLEMELTGRNEMLEVDDKKKEEERK